MAAEWMSPHPAAPLPQGLAYLLSNRRRRNQVLQARGLPPRRQIRRPILQRATIPPPGGKHGGLLGYQGGGFLPGKAWGQHVKGFLGKTSGPGMREWDRDRANRASHIQQAQRNLAPPGPRGWQEGGPVGVAPEEVEMAAEIFARATPEQQAQITGGGGGPGMMDEEAAIGEALAMAMGGGGGPPMDGAPPMGGMI